MQTVAKVILGLWFVGLNLFVPVLFYGLSRLEQKHDQLTARLLEIEQRLSAIKPD